ncbi:hypothetical protein PMI08_04240 [Brevibacillus sp. CF112]|uniref:hypothetical protein n=1 Tax=Brevibacillus TaxID=55080 RepID=UPI00027155A5|nr:hypothetical protein [Brevibacillus sp. CF112]EJL40773.1 hypothetical protein PMI08_04240 [Brevibacillus sp. CF112]
MKCPSCGRTAQLIKSGQLSNGVIKRRYSCNYGCPPFSTEEWLSSKLPAAQAQKTQEEIERLAAQKARQLAERMAEVMAKGMAEQMAEERMKAVRVEFSRMVDALQVYRSKVGF